MTTKVRYIPCSRCKREISILAKDDAIIIAVRCADCNDKMKELMIVDEK